MTNGEDSFCGISNQTINTINQIADPTIISVETQQKGNNGSITLFHTLDDDVIYNLHTSVNGSNDFNFNQAVSGVETDLVSLNTASDYYCYRIDTYDACNDFTIESEITCSTLFSVSTAEDGNQIIWNTDETEAREYNILRDNSLLYNENDPSVTQFIDTAVICNREYVYNIQSVFQEGSSIGLDTAVVASRSGILPRITDIPSSTISNQSVQIDWGPPDTGEVPFSRYIIEKNINNRGWRTAGTTLDTTFFDTNATFVGSHSYRVTYDDDCGNIATSSPSTFPIIISQVSARGRIVQYEWNRYETWLQGIRGYAKWTKLGNRIQQ